MGLIPGAPRRGRHSTQAHGLQPARGGGASGAEWTVEATGGRERRASGFPAFPSLHCWHPPMGTLHPGGRGGLVSISSASFITSITQFSSVAQSCQTLCNPMDCSTPGLPVHHQLLEFTQTRVH